MADTPAGTPSPLPEYATPGNPAVAVLWVLSLLLAILPLGCAASRPDRTTTPGFVLSDDAALDRLMATRHVADLRSRLPIKLTCWVEASAPDERRLYLGEEHGDHTVRLGAYRVTADGRVWVNADPTFLLEDQWAEVE
jgi:hypothetical protein